MSSDKETGTVSCEFCGFSPMQNNHPFGNLVTIHDLCAPFDRRATRKNSVLSEREEEWLANYAHASNSSLSVLLKLYGFGTFK